jgi:chaperonin GroES
MMSQQATPEKSAINMLSDRVLLQLPSAEGERTSRAGILIPATAQLAKRLIWAEVISVGSLVRSVSQGDQALFLRDDAFEVEVRGDDYLILRERDIHAVASPKNDGEGTGLYL